MRYEQIHAGTSYEKVDVAAVWPASAQLAPLPLHDIDRPLVADAFRAAPSAPDIPAAAGGLIAAAYAALIAAFALATVGSRESIFMIVVSELFVVAYFTVPRFFLHIEPAAGRRPTLARFLSDGIATMTGHTSGRDALVQMLIVPVLLTVGVIAMGIAAAFIV